ncbi:hypothetical protein R5Q34_004584 [Salmonella enterica]|nr:hypothetical protein [Salmonella enterica]
MSIVEKISKYTERNKWLNIVIAVVMINAMLIIGAYLQNLNSESNHSFSLFMVTIGAVIRFLSLILLVYAGVLNMMCNTISAKVFRVVSIAAMLAGFIAFLINTFTL